MQQYNIRILYAQKYNFSVQFLLTSASGIAVCGDCGRQMSQKVSTVAGRKYVYYMCSANKREGICTGHRIREEELTEAVTESRRCHIDRLAELKDILDYIGTLPMQDADVKRLEARMVQMEEEAGKYERLKVSAYEDLKDGLIIMYPIRWTRQAKGIA